MEIIDSHHHIWDDTKIRYTLFETISELQGAFSVDAYDSVARSMGVTASICIEAASAGADGMTELHWLSEETRRRKIVERLVAWVPVELPTLSKYLDELETLDDERIVGVRRSFEFEPDDFPARPEVIRGVQLVAERGYTVDLVLFHRSLRAAIELVRGCPDVLFILDHLGKPNLRETLSSIWADEVTEMASMGNVVCKVSGLVTETNCRSWKLEDLKRPIEHVIARFGWDRVMFGSDWPLCNLAGGFKRWLDAVQWCVRDATEGQQQAFFAQNARRVYTLTGDGHIDEGAIATDGGI